VPFGRDFLDMSDPEMARDAAVALIARARTRAQPFRDETSRVFLPVLEKAVRAHPDDLPARECLGVALAWQGKFDLALATCVESLERAPRRELILCDAGVIAERAGRKDRSLGYWRQVSDLNPWSSRYRFEVARLQSEQGDWESAVRESRQLLARNGGHANSRLLLMQYYLRNGMNGPARAELEAALALHPPNEADLRVRFNELLR
jgi:tetratricopeptide (TPR) repeat protein